MKASLKITLLGAALAVAGLAAAEPGAHPLSAGLQSWLHRDLGAEIQRDAELYRPRLSRNVAALEVAAAEFKAHVLAASLQPWLQRDLRAEIRTEVETWFNEKYARIALVDAALADNMVCLAE